MILHGFSHQFILGALVTSKVGVGCFIFGCALGLAGAGAKMSRLQGLRIMANVYTTVIRGLPNLLTIMIVYFGGTATLSRVVGRYVEVNALWAGIFALSLVFGAYATEVFRGAILAVPRGQIEAAQALGLSRRDTYRFIVLPQAWRYALPGIGNQWQATLKETSLVSVIGLEELMRKAAIAAGRTHEPFTMYMGAALFYLILTSSSDFMFRLAERRANRGLVKE